MLRRQPKRRVEDSTSAPSFGTAVHRALEAYYTEGMDPAEYAHDTIYTPYIDSIKVEEPYTATVLGSQRDLACIMLRGYKEWAENTGLDANYSSIEPEKVLDLELWPGVRLTGKLDLLLRRTDGALGIRDFKTADSFDTSLLHLNEQMLTYGVLLQAQEPQEFVLGSHVLLKKVKQTSRAKPPFYIESPVYHNARELELHKRRLEVVIQEMEYHQYMLKHVDEIEAGIYPYPTRDCSWDCKYQEPCSLMNTGDDWRGYLEEHYVESGHGYSRGFWSGEVSPRRDRSDASPYS